jgi:hypothetical protein
MGTWGAGNFSNDGALDYIAHIEDSLVKDIERILGGGARLNEEIGREFVLIPNVVIISLLCEHCNAAPPKEKDVKRWRKKYLQAYDKEIDAWGVDEEFKAQRREVIDQTFAKLQEQARAFWKKTR